MGFDGKMVRGIGREAILSFCGSKRHESYAVVRGGGRWRRGVNFAPINALRAQTLAVSPVGDHPWQPRRKHFHHTHTPTPVIF